jgi:hypothetical protein
MSSQSMNTIMLDRCIWIKFEITLSTNIDKVDTNFIVGVQFMLKYFLRATVGASVLFELTYFLMLYRFLIR